MKFTLNAGLVQITPSLPTQLLLFLLFTTTVHGDGSKIPLLKGSLRTTQRAACDGNLLKLECPPNTVVTLVTVEYHILAAPSLARLCPPSPATSSGEKINSNPSSGAIPSASLPASPGRGGTSFPGSSTASGHSTSGQRQSSGACVPGDPVLANTLQYAMLTKIESACRTKSVCSITVQIDNDPCPEVSKFVEVAFKCKPVAFLNKVACEGTSLQLKCQRPTERIVILGGFFGSTATPVHHCPPTKLSPHLKAPSSSELGPQPSLVCEDSYATEYLISKCLGKRDCKIDADLQTFTNPGCPEGTALHLKATYQCVPKFILSKAQPGDGMSFEDEQRLPSDPNRMVDAPRYAPDELGKEEAIYTSESYIGPSKSAEDHLGPHFEPDGNVHSRVDPSVSFVPIYGRRPSLELELDAHDDNCSHVLPPNTLLTGMATYFNFYKLVEDHMEQIVLYLLISVSVSLLSAFIILSFRLVARRRGGNKKDNQKSPKKDNLSDATSPFHAVTSDDILADLEAEGLVSSPGTALLTSHYGTYAGHGHTHAHNHHGHSHHHHHHHHVHPINSQPDSVRYVTSSGPAGSIPMTLTGTLGRSTLRRPTVQISEVSMLGEKQYDSQTEEALLRGMLANESNYF